VCGDRQLFAIPVDLFLEVFALGLQQGNPTFHARVVFGEQLHPLGKGGLPAAG